MSKTKIRDFKHFFERERGGGAITSPPESATATYDNILTNEIFKKSFYLIQVNNNIAILKLTCKDKNNMKKKKTLKTYFIYLFREITYYL